MFKKIIFLFIIFYYSNGYSQPRGSERGEESHLVELPPESQSKRSSDRAEKRREAQRRSPSEAPRAPVESQEGDARRRRRRRKRKRAGGSSIPMRYSYSGADCKAVAYFDTEGDLDYTGGETTVNLEGLATISYSIYEAKSPVRRLGHRAVSGYTKGIRTVAGSMVFLVIEDHPLAELVKQDNKSKMWSEDLDEKGHSYKSIDTVKRYVSTMLKPFNIGLFYKTEIGFNDLSDSYEYSPMYKTSFNEMAHLVISGVEVVSEGMVTSVNDMVTEVTMQFVAHDVFNIERQDTGSKSEIAAGTKPLDQRGGILGTTSTEQDGDS